MPGRARDPRSAEELFDRALELPPGRRRELLDRECAEDPELRREVESLLAADAKADGLLQGPPAGEVVRAAADAAAGEDPLLGRVIGPYRITRLLGAGGMGAVYLGERADSEVEMRAAVKIIHRGLLAAERFRSRFLQERQVLARLAHPNIARLLDAGTTDEGIPYLVMEWIDGLPIDRHCAERDLSVRERLELFVTVCAAVQSAHQQLVVHRDLKPSNILVDGSGQPKLLDFGIAKMLEPGDAPDATRTAGHVLTPLYASPEHVRGEPVTTASDVYSLGVILYQLLTGTRPHDLEGLSLHEVDRVLRETGIRRPSRAVRRGLARRLRGDLDNIVLMATRWEPERRYASVEQLAEDVRRHLDGMPVRARPDTAGYRLSKFVRRNRAAVAAGGIVFLSLVAATAVSTVLFLRAERAQQEAEAQRATAEGISAFLQATLGSVDPRVARGRDATLLREILDSTARRIEVEVPQGSEVAADLQLTIGRTYRAIAALDESERHLRAALSARRASREPGDPRVAQAAHELGALLADRSAFAEAESLLTEALGARRSRSAEDPGSAVETLLALAPVAAHTGRPAAEQEELLREAVDMARGGLGEEHPSHARALARLWSFLWYHDARPGAPPLMERAVAIWRALPDPDPLDFADALHDAAVMRRDLEEFEAAEALFQESLERKRRVLDADHPGIADTLVPLASLHEFRGDLEAAEPLYREALRVQTESYGDPHMEVGTTHNNLAGLLAKAARWDEAERHYGEALRNYRAVLGNDHAWVAIVLANTIRLAEMRGDCPAIQPLVAEHDRIFLAVAGRDHWRRAAVQSARGGCLARDGRFDEAEEILLAAHEHIVAGVGEGHDYARASAERIVALYEAWGRSELAKPFRAQAGRGPARRRRSRGTALRSGRRIG